MCGICRAIHLNLRASNSRELDLIINIPIYSLVMVIHRRALDHFAVYLGTLIELSIRYLMGRAHSNLVVPFN